jgi:DNA repair protein RadC
MHFSSFGSQVSLRFWGAAREQGAEKEKNIMHQKRATQNRNLFTATEPEIMNSHAMLVGINGNKNHRSAAHPDQEIPIKPRPSIHNPDDIVAILSEELLKADREKLVCVMLITKNVVIGIDVVSAGAFT